MQHEPDELFNTIVQLHNTVEHIRKVTIEECARVVERYYPSVDQRTSIAAAIRALKGKP